MLKPFFFVLRKPVSAFPDGFGYGSSIRLSMLDWAEPSPKTVSRQRLRHSA